MAIRFERYRMEYGYLYDCQDEGTYCLDTKQNVCKLEIGDLIPIFEFSYSFPIVKKSDVPDFYDYVNSHMKAYEAKIDSLFDKIAEGSGKTSEFRLYERENHPCMLPDYQKKEIIIINQIAVIRVDPCQSS